MYVNEQKKTIFIAHPRTASSATGYILLKMGFVIEGDHHFFDTELDLRGWTVASTVRNPFDALVSWYYNKPRIQPFDLWLPEFLDGCHYLQGLRMFYGSPYCTHVLHYETLQDDFDGLCNDIGIQPMTIPQRNVSNRPSSFYMAKYDFHGAKRVTERFRDDFLDNGYHLSLHGEYYNETPKIGQLPR